MKTLSILTSMAIMLALTPTSQAQVGVKTGIDSIDTEPYVPIEVVAKGRAAVTDYLSMQLDHVLIGYTGASVVNGNTTYFSTNDLAAMGYTHRGSFTELSAALSRVFFSQPVIPTPQGWYDVGVIETHQTADGRNTMQGSGWLNIQTMPDGSLSGGQFQPYVGINEHILILRSGFSTAAELIGQEYAATQQLPIYYDQYGNSSVEMPTGKLEDGYLAMADGIGGVTVWDLQHNTTFKGKQAIAILGKTQSSDVQGLLNPTDITVSNVTFYANGDQIFGRFPLIDLVTTNSFKQWIQFPVKVWGIPSVLNPSSVVVMPIYLNDSGKSGMQVGQEYPLQKSIGPDGSVNWGFYIPPGDYHIRVKFDNVLDWEDDPNAKG